MSLKQTVCDLQATVVDLQNQINALSKPDYYEHFAVWGEEASALSNNQLEFSYGNGAAGQIGVPLPPGGDWELWAVGVQADVATGGGAGGPTLEVAVVDVIVNANVHLFTASGATNNVHFTETLATPLPVADPFTVGFRTVTEVGNWSDVRVVAYFRRVRQTF